MVGRQSSPQPKLFYMGFHPEERIRKDHILRKIFKLIDFNFIYNEVEDHYGVNGNVSVPPPVILKMMLLLILYNVRSERELMQTIAERLDWLWFLRYDLDDEIPNHSVLSKARKKWGVETFERFFDRIVSQCVEAGLVDGTKLFTDASLIDADASNNSVDANIKAHIPSIERSHRSRRQRKEIFSKEAFHYDSVTDTFKCPAGQTLKGRRYSKKRNDYEYKAPAKVCMNCQLREKCTRSKNGRTVHRHLRQDELDKMLKIAENRGAKKDIKARRHISERSFAWSKRYGYKRARWRRLGRMQIQDFLVATVQNIEIMARYLGRKKTKAEAQAVVVRRKEKGRWKEILQRAQSVFGCCFQGQSLAIT